MQPEGNLQALQDVGEERRVLLGAWKHHPHLLEGDATGGFLQQAPHQGPNLGCLAGGRDELHGAVAGRPSRRWFEERRSDAAEAGRRGRWRDRGEDRPAPRDGGYPVTRRPGREGGPAERRGQLPLEDPHG